MAGLLGTSLTTDEMWDTLKSIGRGVNLGSTSGLLGGPVDLATMLLNNPGMLHPGLLGTRGLGIENPVGGSKWIEQKLQPKGLLPKRQGNWQETAGELASAFVNPATAAAVAGPKLYAMESKIAQNAAAPTTLNKQAGVVEFFPWNKTNTPPKANAPLPDGVQSIVRAPNPNIGLLGGNMDVTIGGLDGGKFFSKFSPIDHTSKQKPFYAVGDNLDELITATQNRLSASERGAAASKSRTLEGKLQSEFGDRFSLARSQRSESFYVTDRVSGEKFRFSNHDLPLNYVQADKDFPVMKPNDVIGVLKKHYFGQ